MADLSSRLPLSGFSPAGGSGWSRQSLLALGLILAGTLVLRLPTFFEPPWHSDEGIFAAVAQRLLHGGTLYADAWESKPPLFLLLYVGLFKVFGAGIFGLRLASTASALLTEIALYAISVRLVTPRRALIAPVTAGLLVSVPFWEGTLALTEIFAILPTALGVLCVLASLGENKRNAQTSFILLAGVLFGAAFLVRQTSIGVAILLFLWLLLGRRCSLRAPALAGAGFAGVIAVVVLSFAFFGSFHWFWDANIGFFFKYVPSGKELPLAYRPVIILPLVVAVAALTWGRVRHGQVPLWGLPVLWLAVTVAGAMLTGRPYSHYMLQVFPPLGLTLAFGLPALLSRLAQGRQGLTCRRLPGPAMAVVLSLALTWGYVVIPMFGGNVLAMRYTRGPAYYSNFLGRVLGVRSETAYDNYFDRRVIPTEEIERALGGLHAKGQKVYIWGEYPWVYALADVQPATRYVTSFYVLLLPYLDVGLADSLTKERPQFIVLLDDAKPKFHGSSAVVDIRYANAKRNIDRVIAANFHHVALVGRAQIYARTSGKAAPGPSSGLAPPRWEDADQEP